MNIWKYPIKITTQQTLSMPIAAQILTAQMQGDQCCLWALVSVSEHSKCSPRLIEVFGTGHEITPADNRRYIATVQWEGGALIFHIFERN